ncbi:hypothetical protein X759_09605 [Mesorhizobium sp. LSHC420B00]|nr:hypothetical protein X759_09605 [Mesorhizobium sp. LSHC420B00]
MTGWIRFWLFRGGKGQFMARKADLRLRAVI